MMKRQQYCRSNSNASEFQVRKSAFASRLFAVRLAHGAPRGAPRSNLNTCIDIFSLIEQSEGWQPRTHTLMQVCVVDQPRRFTNYAVVRISYNASLI